MLFPAVTKFPAHSEWLIIWSESIESIIQLASRPFSLLSASDVDCSFGKFLDGDRSEIGQNRQLWIRTRANPLRLIYETSNLRNKREGRQLSLGKATDESYEKWRNQAGSLSVYLD